MANKILGKIYLKELEAEANATRKCLERIPYEKLQDWQPHPRSMKMGYLALLCAEIPNWLTYIITKGEIDFATFKHAEIKSSEDLVKNFDIYLKEAKEALESVSDEELNKPFSLKNKDDIIMTTTKKDSISSSINHLVHHRGQLTVYMRLNEIKVPSIYGPSADEKTF